MTGMPPATRLAKFLVDRRVPDEYKAAVAAWAADRDGGGLHTFLGFDRSGASLAARDYHIRRAWALVKPLDLDSVRAAALRAEIDRFCGAVWEYVRADDEPGPDWSELKREIFYAVKANNGRDLPRARRLIDISATLGLEVAETT